ncbi:MAG: glycine cleavage system protein H [Thermoflexus sp.]|uniref:glycine cleavage system protein GcvH n=1 Tax=Thermoflexus sp. TaxID=1969742 RepID=UPI00331A4DA0
MNIPPDLRYTESDEWVRLEGEEAVCGVTDYAQSQLSDVVYVELPEVGRTFQKGEVFGTIESVKAAADLYMPMSGTITAVNTELTQNPEWVNQDPYGRAWLIRFRPSNLAEYETLMDAAAYRAHCEARAH